MILDDINNMFENERGKSGGLPSGMRYHITQKYDSKIELLIEDTGNDKKILKIIDVWGYAALSSAYNKLNDKISMRFILKNPQPQDKPKYEALKRRLSYLSITNGTKITLETEDKKDTLYTEKELFFRSEHEIVRSSFAKRSDEDCPGRLEKDFQTYLFGKGLHNKDDNTIRTNERLALFGDDFIYNSSNKNAVEREFPTGSFLREIKEENRILPTEFVDLVTLNKNKEIAIIELKFNDAPLEVIAQALNYALFFQTYKEQITPLLDKKLNSNTSKSPIKAYIVSNVFHKRFNSVWPYYSKGRLPMIKIIMGYNE